MKAFHEREELDQVTQRYTREREGRPPRLEMPRRRNHRAHGPLDFNALAAEGNHFINAVAENLGSSRNRAARITRAVLHAIRDRMPADDSIEFAQGLPLVMKGVWLDQYDISSTPVVVRTASGFLEMVADKAPFTARNDFPTPEHTAHAIRCVVRVLEDFMDMGQTDQMRNILGKEICKIFDRTGYF